MVSRAHVVKVETSIKRGGIAQLGPKTLIVGPSRSGKSTRVNAIEAAGSGRVSDVAGRTTLARDADLIMLAPNNTDSVFALVKLSDGSACEWNLSRGHRAKRTGPEIAFPLRDVREAILGEPDKARKWILRAGSGDLVWGDVIELVPEALRARLPALTRSDLVDGFESAGDRLAASIDLSKRRVREANSQAKGARESIKNVTALGSPPSEAEIQAAQDLVTRLAAGGALASSRARLAELRDMHRPRLQGQITAQEEALSSITTRLAKLPALPPVSDLARSALTVAEEVVRSGARACAICGSAVDPSVLALRVKSARSKLDEALKVGQTRTELERQKRDAEDRLTLARADLARMDAEIERLTGYAGAEVQGDPAAAGKALADLLSRKAAWDLARRSETTALENEKESLEWSQLADALSAALGTLVGRARVAFEKRIQAFLPPTWIFGVDLLDGDREVLRIGLRERKDGPVQAALSGVEWATVTAALGLATAPENGPVVIAPEERAFDSETLAEVMEGFGAVGAAAQVILTSPVAPSRKVPGWTVIEVGAKKEKEKEAVDPRQTDLTDFVKPKEITSFFDQE